MVDEVELTEANPRLLTILFPDGRQATASTSDLAPSGSESSKNELFSDRQDPFIDEDRSQIDQVALPGSLYKTFTDITDNDSFQNATDSAGRAEPTAKRRSSRSKNFPEPYGKPARVLLS